MREKKKEAEKAEQASSRAEGGGATLLRRRSVKAAEEGKAKKVWLEGWENIVDWGENPQGIFIWRTI